MAVVWTFFVILSLVSASPPPCSRLASYSLRGFESLSDLEPFPNEHQNSTTSTILTASCCEQIDERSTCHGGFILPKLDLPVNDGADFNRIAQLYQKQHNRHRRSTDQCDAGCFPSEIECCPMEVSIFYPAVGKSAITNKDVDIVQAPPFYVQPVLVGRCKYDESSILDAHCKQLFVSEIMAVTRSDTGKIITTWEPIFVESGCECQFNPASSQVELYDGPDVDEVANLYLSMWKE